MADVTGDGRADIVAFGDAGTYTAVATGNGMFGSPHSVTADFGYDQGWRVDKHPRFVTDVTGDGRADVVGFGAAGIYTAVALGYGGFAAPQLVTPDFGYDAGSWRVEQHPRFVADITGDWRGDIVGFGNAGVYTSVAQGNGGFW